MKKQVFILSLLFCGIVSAWGQEIPDFTDQTGVEKVYDTNFALSANGSSATALSGNAGEAIDGKDDTRWESASSDPQTWDLDMGQKRIFNMITIVWEGAYGKTFDIQLSEDGDEWYTMKTIEGQTLAGFPHQQDIDMEREYCARYIRFNGRERGTGWGYSFWEFRVYLPAPSVLTTLEATIASPICKVGASEAITLLAKDQNGFVMSEYGTVEYTITPTSAGVIENGAYIPSQKGEATITAHVGDVYATPFSVFAFDGDNLALNKAMKDKDGNYVGTYYGGDTPNKAVNGNDGDVWQGSPTNGDVAGSHVYDAWFVVDLGAFYNIDLMTIHFEGACSEAYHIDFSTNNITWTTSYNFDYPIGQSNHTDYITDFTDMQFARYIRFWSTKASTGWGMKIYELQVFGSSITDSEAPTNLTVSANGTSATTVQLKLKADDNFKGLLTYNVSYGENQSASVSGAAGVETTLDIDGLTVGMTYTFSVLVSDESGNQNATPVEVQAAPVGDSEKPTWIGDGYSALTYDYQSASFKLKAEDNSQGTIRYSVKNGETELVTASANSGEEVSISLTNLAYLTKYTLTAIAKDASDNESTPLSIVFTTMAPPFPVMAAPMPDGAGKDVRPIYSDAFVSILKHDFNMKTWSNVDYEIRTIESDNHVVYNMSTSHNTAWGVNGDGDEGIIPIDDYNHGTIIKEGGTTFDCKGLDASEMEYLHIDLWSNQVCTNASIKICDWELAKVNLDGTGWNSFDIPLAGFTSKNDENGLFNIRWMKFDDFSTVTALAIDNVYFWANSSGIRNVSASVNDAAMGTAVVKQDGEEVTQVEDLSEVTFVATPADGYDFVCWQQGAVVVSESVSYTTTASTDLSLLAVFETHRDIYCHELVTSTTGGSKKLYMTLSQVADSFHIVFDGSSECQLTELKSANFTINDVCTNIEYTDPEEGEIHKTCGQDVPFKKENGRVRFSKKGYGSAEIVFAVDVENKKTWRDIHVWNHAITFITASNDEVAYNDFPNQYRIVWNTTCSDTEAPVMDAPKAEALNTTDIRLTLKATDNWEGPITYTISREGAENIVVTAASGETKTYDVTGLATDATYTFSVVATDTKGNSCTEQECSVTLSAGGDVTAPTDVTVAAKPLTDKSIELTLFANDDYDGNITYMITSVPSVSIDNVVAPRGTTTKTVVRTLTANTKYTFSVVASDAAGNEADAVSTSATTFSGNLALNKPTIVGAGDNIGFSNDGDTGTRWGSGQHTHPANDWWAVNLGAVYDIQNIRIIWEQARPKYYDILVSNDGTNWTVAQSYSQLPEYEANVKISVDYPITATGRYIKVAATSTDGGYDNLNWGISFWEFEAYGTPAVDTVAPVITEFVANGASATSILVRATATDNFCGDLTYTFYCDGVAVTPVVKPAGTEATYVFNNLENKEYTFKVMVSDGTNETISEEVTASPVADDQAPTGLAVSNIVPEYDRVTFDLSATDDKGGMITYIVKNGDTQVATAEALSGATANIVVESLDYLTDYTFTATAQDASGNTCEPINITFTTTAPPFPLEAAPAPGAYPEAAVRPIYSDAFPNILAHDFLKTTWVTIGIEERTIDDDKFLFYTVTETAHATAWGDNNDGDNAIIALDGYNDGTYKGVDIRQMNMLHVDLWSIVACQNVELRVCDALVATVQLDGTGWNSFDIDISSLSNDVKTNVRWVKFDRFTEANTFAIDNFFFYQKYDITLDEAQDNATTISTNAGKYADVTLQRSFEADGFNYTLCLPFAMTEEQCLAAFGEGYKLFLMGNAYMKTADVMYLPFSEVTSIEAGKPYLFCPAFNVENPTIEGVTINAAAPVAQGNNFATMTGIYSPTIVAESNYVLGDDNWLYQSDGTQMYGLRCYFTFGSGVSQNVRARAVFHNTDVVTDLETIDGVQCTMHDGKYVINGQFVIIRNGKQYNALGF